MKLTVEERFWAKVQKSEGCWLWLASTDGGRYGTFYANGRSVRAHRFSWELVNGPMDRELDACHTCDVTRCVRPDHIFPGTAAENTHDAQRKGRIPIHDAAHMRRMRQARVRMWRERHPERDYAHNALGRAIRSRRIFKPAHCTRCGSTKRIMALHRDYAQPLDVEWLCHWCHMRARTAALGREIL